MTATVENRRAVVLVREFYGSEKKKKKFGARVFGVFAGDFQRYGSGKVWAGLNPGSASPRPRREGPGGAASGGKTDFRRVFLLQICQFGPRAKNLSCRE